MAGTPTEAEIQAIITNSVDILEKHRVYSDATATASGELDVLEQSLEGEYAPGLANVAADFRAGLSNLVTQGQALAFFEPLLFEYAKFISDNPGSGTGAGSGSTDVISIMRALYEHMINNTLTVESRAITYDTSATTSDGFGGSIIGTGAIQRLTVDSHAHNLEACAVEKKIFRCVSDQNTGTKEDAELFSIMGEAPSQDALGKNAADVLGQLGNGAFSGGISSLNAGTGPSGSKLNNSSFSTFDSGATPRFSQWAQTIAGSTAAAGDITQSTGTAVTNYYRSHPNASLNAALKITGGGSGDDSYTFTQTLSAMRLSSVDSDTPYFLRIMYKSDGTAVGTLKLRLGSTEDTVTVSGTTWKELLITADKDTWTRNFNQDGFGIDIEWESTAAGGVLLIDDAIFAPYTEIDGTFWAFRQTHATAPLPWLLDDTLELTDTGGAPGTAEIQYWLYRAGLGYLPHTTGTPTWTEPA